MSLRPFVLLSALFFTGCAGMDTTIALDYTGKDGRSIGTSVRLNRSYAKGANGPDTTRKVDANGLPNFGPR